MEQWGVNAQGRIRLEEDPKTPVAKIQGAGYGGTVEYEDSRAAKPVGKPDPRGGVTSGNREGVGAGGPRCDPEVSDLGLRPDMVQTGAGGKGPRPGWLPDGDGTSEGSRKKKDG